LDNHFCLDFIRYAKEVIFISVSAPPLIKQNRVVLPANRLVIQPCFLGIFNVCTIFRSVEDAYTIHKGQQSQFFSLLL
jgi:hypothetical protein